MDKWIKVEAEWGVATDTRVTEKLRIYPGAAGENFSFFANRVTVSNIKTTRSSNYLLDESAYQLPPYDLTDHR